MKTNLTFRQQEPNLLYIPICRNSLVGNCRYNTNCYFSHNYRRKLIADSPPFDFESYIYDKLAQQKKNEE